MVVGVENKLKAHHFFSVKSLASILVSTFLITLIYHFATDGTSRDFFMSASLLELVKIFLAGFAVNFLLCLVGVSLLEGKNTRSLKGYLVMGFQLSCIPPVVLYLEANFFHVTGMATQIFDIFLFLFSFPVFIASGFFSATVYWCFSFADSVARSLLYIASASVFAYFAYYAAFILILTV